MKMYYFLILYKCKDFHLDHQAPFKNIKYFDNIDIDASRDFLSGALRREIFIGFVKDLMENNEVFSLIMIDIDNFKSINDTYGHQKGDEVISRVANEIIAISNDTGIVGRFGGDEFIIASSIVEYEALWNYIRSIHQAVQKIRFIDGQKDEFNITLTSGATRYPYDDNTYDGLFLKTDKALYRGKEKGRNCFIIYDENKHGSIDLVNKRYQKSAANVINTAYEMITSEKGELKDNIARALEFLRNTFDITKVQFYKVKEIDKFFSKDGVLAKEEKEIFLKELKTKGVFFLNDYSELKNKYDMVNFHEYCWVNTVKSFVAFKIYGYGKTFGYLTFVDKRRKRIWQKEDIMIFSVVAKMLGFSIHYDRIRKKINRGK